ncbi:serine/arginine-rich splicing factor 6-like [Branchiostoma floridae]|uniref:Serine/arginine-rich splicing factor 6-like n=1 Tax=Branchiostoma floridae TaxID=7739 RepID=A0A9J7HIL7_BRAFL|nr:serine/arginine-rich splicing factor 6-like [Branchiostoma floridae]
MVTEEDAVVTDGTGTATGAAVDSDRASTATMVVPTRGRSYGGSQRGFGPGYRGHGGGQGSKGKKRYGSPVRTNYRLIVKNLSSRCSWQDLKDYVRQAGEVTFADVHKQNRNEGIVEFSTYQDMENAWRKLDGTEIYGCKIKLVKSQPA